MVVQILKKLLKEEHEAHEKFFGKARERLSKWPWS
jgi:hypothetical protein